MVSPDFGVAKHVVLSGVQSSRLGDTVDVSRPGILEGERLKRGGFLTASDRDELARFPAEIGPDDLVRCFALRPSDHAEVVEGRYGPAGRLAAGLQIGALRLLGFVPSDLTTALPDVVRFVADQVGAVPADLVEYTDRAQTRSDHVATVERHLGFRKPERGDVKRLGDWLTERALEHDRPTVLFRLACDWILAEGLVRPGVTTVERAVIAARQRATEETYLRVVPQLDPEMRVQLDGLLAVDDEVGMTRLVWLRRPTTGSVPVVIREHLDRLALLRTLGADRLDLSGVNPNRVRHLAQLGRRMTRQAIARLEGARRYQILAATVGDELVRLTDGVLDLFDIALATVDRDARSELERMTRSNATAANETVRLFGQIAKVFAGPDDPRPPGPLRHPQPGRRRAVLPGSGARRPNRASRRRQSPRSGARPVPPDPPVRAPRAGGIRLPRQRQP